MAEKKEKQCVSDKSRPMSRHNTPDNVCIALTAFIIEIRKQTAALRAYDNIFQNNPCNNAFIQLAHDMIWRELLSEIARIFDKANTGSNENCTLLRLKELCYSEEYLFLFPNKEKDSLLQSLEEVFTLYYKLPISKSRKKQLAHHDLKQVTVGKHIEIFLEQVEKLIEDVTDAFCKIYTRFSFGAFEVTFIKYDVLVEQFEKDIRKLIE